MKVSDIIASARARINQPEDGGRFADGDYIQFINDCLLDMADAMRSVQKTISIPGNGTNSYPLPADLLRIEQVTAAGCDVSALPLSYMGLDATKSPHYSSTGYVVRGTDIIFTWDITTGNEIALHYRARPPYVETTESNLQVDEAWKMAIVYKVVANCWEAMFNFERANYYTNQHNEEKERRRDQLSDRQFRLPSVPMRPPVE